MSSSNGCQRLMNDQFRRPTSHRVRPICRNLAAFILLATAAELAGSEVKFNRDVRPILAANCFDCHGRHRSAADLRLDLRESAVQPRAGKAAIVPGQPDASELIRRIFSTDPDKVMPPPNQGHTLSDGERRTLRRWIAEGAKYETHWAFTAPKKALPTATPWGNNEIDRFIYRRLLAAKLTPQPLASREQLIRRVTFDLTGLPPTVAEIDAFLADGSPGAYERVVDRLLSSPRFGERMAMWWLDGARYGDSHGYDNDLENSQWPWRNWVVEAFNQNMPFDQFTIEQLAGDLLPDATEAQILATAFNRNHRFQTEDGAIDEEWRTEYVIDRVETMGTVWMGLTLSCARCHDHKYDPISQQEFYQLFALFNNLDEKGYINNLRGSARPRVRYKAAEFETARADIQQRINDESERDQALTALQARHPYVMVMQEMEQPRPAFLLVRGRYDARGGAVTPGLPAALPPLRGGQQVTRLSLARWLVDGRHPLTGRVFVNRIWEQVFGAGIVETSEDFGVQARWPSHPDLLDWLAVDFAEHGWDVKRLVKQIVTSAAYQQSNVVDETRLLRDPQNRLISRGPRIRLQAEMIRDQALATAGLLHEQIGGPSVYPYQPVGLWEEVEKRGKYQQSRGEGLYRRSLYTAIRRTVLAPELALFDMPSREVCTVRRSRTNTPLQALALMNNVTYVEAGKKLAERMMLNGATPQERISWGFRCATSRRATPAELAVLTAGYQRRLAVYRESPDKAEALLNIGESTVSEAFNKPELAAMTTVANVLLNLDEVIHK